jgi:hypothetical protein
VGTRGGEGMMSMPDFTSKMWVCQRDCSFSSRVEKSLGVIMYSG